MLMAPEQLGKEDVLERVRAAAPSLSVVDEAHYISEWGHDFRPDYLRLGAVVEELGRPVVLAHPATAAPPVREEIPRRLRLREPEDRPNIPLRGRAVPPRGTHGRGAARAGRRGAEAGHRLCRHAAGRRGAGQCTRGARDARRGRPRGHARRGRERAETALMADEVDVVVAAVAFGTGVDKAKVRFISTAIRATPSTRSTQK